MTWPLNIPLPSPHIKNNLAFCPQGTSKQGNPLFVLTPLCYSRGINKALPEFLVWPQVNFYWLGKVKTPGLYQYYMHLSYFNSSLIDVLLDCFSFCYHKLRCSEYLHMYLSLFSRMNVSHITEPKGNSKFLFDIVSLIVFQKCIVILKQGLSENFSIFHTFIIFGLINLYNLSQSAKIHIISISLTVAYIL